MIIAPHHRPGHWRHSKGEDVYEPKQAWPDDCYVQWGGNGVVLSRDADSYMTAFFEAFPKDPSTFIRGEGATVDEAEAQAFEKFQRHKACPGHEFERREYRNGGGLCKHCNLWNSKVFDPLERCAICDKATYHSSTTDGRWWCEDHAGDRPEEFIHDGEKRLRKFLSGRRGRRADADSD